MKGDKKMAKYNSGMTLGRIMDDPDMKAVVLKHMPNVESDPRYSMGRSFTLNEIRYEISASQREMLEKIIAELNAL